ncbi:MAG: glucans biosynthesis glucosyltransferase MdoH, partial [Candidatus Competibacterales bacterium]
MLAVRRSLFALAVIGTLIALTAILVNALGVDGSFGLEWAMVALFICQMPWAIIGFWNAIIGLAVLHGHRSPLSLLLPWWRQVDPQAPLTTRTAVIMPVYNEDPERVFRHLATVVESLDATGWEAAFEIFLLSDSDDPTILAEEERRFEAWRQRTPGGAARLHYRRRATNVGKKVGNVWDFLERWGASFEHFVILDADSVMAGATLVRLVQIMEAKPKIGILQTLVVGLPTVSPFARIFQFGMRHSMRAYTAGSVWWQGPDGPYWGHNAIIRTRAFCDHCRLPVLPGKPPLGGAILSHDQVEATLMRRGGFDVWVIPEEGGSYEENPPHLPAFLKRDLRWCQGNMQYFKLLAHPGLRPMGRLQLALAIVMYTAAPCWYGFMALGLLALVTTGAAPVGEGGFATAVGLFAAVMTMVFAPVVAGFVDVLLRPAARRAYGGGQRLWQGLSLQLGFSLLLGPAMALIHTLFILGLPFGRQVVWGRQQRDSCAVSWGSALRSFWPQLVVGSGMLLALGYLAPHLLPWGLPVVLGLVLAIPFARWTSLEAFGQWLTRRALCAIPEEIHPPYEVRRLGLAAVDLNPLPGDS